MRSLSPSRFPRVGAALSAVMLALYACADQPTQPDPDISFAKGGGGRPTVDAADPNSAPQDITLDVRVIGSGFDNGSVVKFLKGGQSTPKIVTNASTFLDKNNIIANITIAVDAEVTLYDIEVTTRRGKKGIGSELFSVKKKGDTEPQFVITTTDLGTLDEASGHNAQGISSYPNGASIRVVGQSGGRAFFVAPPAAMVELTGPPEPNASILGTKAVDISHGGQIVGQRFVNRGDPEVNGLQPLFWSSSQAVAIVLPVGLARSSYATAIDNSGQIVGQSWDHSDDLDAPHAHAMLWTVDGAGNVTTRDLHEETFALGFINSLAEDINDRGQVVGRAYDGFRERAFLWDNGVVTMLDDPVDPGFSTFANAINNADPVQIIGAAQDQSGTVRALLWTVSGGTVQTEELPVLAGFGPGWPKDLNDTGEVVGNSGSPLNGQGGDGHAILWTFDPQTDERIAVDLGAGAIGAHGIDNSASLAGLTRVVGATTIELGKGRKKSKSSLAILWEVEPIVH